MAGRKLKTIVFKIVLEFKAIFLSVPFRLKFLSVSDTLDSDSEADGLCHSLFQIAIEMVIAVTLIVSL